MGSGELLSIGGPLLADSARAHSSTYLHLVDPSAAISAGGHQDGAHRIDRIEAWATRTHHARMQIGLLLSGALALAVSGLVLVN